MHNNLKSTIFHVIYIIFPFIFHIIVNLIASLYLRDPSISKDIVNLYAKSINIAILFIIWILAFVSKYDNKFKHIKESANFSLSTAIFWVSVRVSIYMLFMLICFCLCKIFPSQKELLPESQLNFITFINAVILAPVGEELLFRLHTFGTTNSLLANGYTPLFKRTMLLICWILSVIYFAFAHKMEDVMESILTRQFDVALLITLLRYSLAGLLYGYVYLKSSNIIFPFLMHFFNNLINFFLYEKLFNEWSLIVPVVCAILASIIAISIFLKKETGEDITGREESTYKEKGS